jgi:hypothetical protein
MHPFLRVVGKVGVPLLAASAWTAVPAAAGEPVDPSTLDPIPPPGAECSADGPWTICQTGLVIDLLNEPAFDLPCGTVYETVHDVRSGIRWYDEDGDLVKRFVTQDAEGTWNLSPTGAGPTVSLSVHANWRNVYAVPGDESTGPNIVHGNGVTIQAPGYGVIAHIAGLELPDGTFHGVFKFVDDPAVVEELCAALTD